MNTIDHVNEHFGRYTVIKLLASNGGYASVYLGEHTVLKTAPPVAIKILHNSLNSEDEKSSFIKEAHILAALQHKYILQIIDADPESGTGFPYIITEFAAKGSLRDRLNTHWQEPLPVEEALRILSQVGRALHHAHQKNIIHRDLKPENILFKSRDQALLADFGIAVVIEKSGPQFVGKTGTPAYMAPEQFKGLASRETDQYSLGCIAYELCTGRRPFKGSSFIHLSFLHATEQPVAPRQYNPQLPSRVEQAILKAMEKHEKDRHPTIIAFLEALGATIPETSRPAEQKKHYSLTNASWQPDTIKAKLHPTVRAQPAIAEFSQIPTSEQTVRQCLEKGEELFKQQQFNAALTVFEQATRLDSKSAEAYYHLGQVLEKLDRPWEAGAAFDRAIHLDSRFTSAYIGKGDLHMAFSRYEEALGDYQRAARVNLKSPQAYFKIGEALFQLERYPEALSANDSAMRFDPNVFETHQQRLTLLHQLKRYDEALAQYDTSISTMPQQVSFYQGKADLLKTLGNHIDAIEVYDLLIQRMPGFIDAYHSKIELLEYIGYDDEVVSSYNQIMQLAPGSLNVYYDEAAFLKRHKRYDEALDVYDQIISLSTNPLEVYYKKIEILEPLYRSEELLTVYNQIFFYMPEDLNILHKKIALLEQLERYEEALEANEAVIRLEPLPTEAYFKKADLLQVLERDDEACETYDEIIKLKLATAKAHYKKGKLLARVGPINTHLFPIPAVYLPRSLKPFIARLFPDRTYQAALAEFEKAYQLARENTAYQDSLKFTLEALGKFQEAEIFEIQDQDAHIFWLSLFNIIHVLVLSIVASLIASSWTIPGVFLCVGGVFAGFFAYQLQRVDEPHHLYNASYLFYPPLFFCSGWIYITLLKTGSIFVALSISLAVFLMNSLANILLDMYGIDIFAFALLSLISGFFSLLKACWQGIREFK